MQQELIDAAVSLGKTIGMSLAQEGKKGKGELFRLRKHENQKISSTR